MKITEFLSDVLPIKRKTSADWVLPALVGLGIGIAAGIGVGMLYAPEPGAEVRLRLRQSASRMKEKAAELAERAKGHVASTAEQTRSQLGRSP